MSRIGRLAKDAVVYGLAGGAGQSLQLLLLPVYSRTFDPDTYGVLEIITATVAVASLVLGLQIDSGMARHFFDEGSDDPARRRRQLLTTGSVLILGFSVLGSSLLVLLSGHLSSWLFAGVGPSWDVWALAFASVPVTLLLTYWLLAFRLERRVQVFVGLQVAWTLLALLLSILFVVVLKGGLRGVFAARLISGLVVLIAAAPPVAGYLTRELSKLQARRILSYGIPLTPSTIGGWTQRYVDRYFVVTFLSASALGVYALAVQISSVVYLLNQAFRYAWIPFAMSIIDRGAESHGEYANVLDYYLALMVLVAGGLTIFAREVVDVIAPSAYAGAASVVGVLSVSWVASGTFAIVGIGVSASKKTAYTATAFLVGAAANIVALQLLIRPLGLMGAAIASLVGCVISSALVYEFSRRLCGLKIGTRSMVSASFLFLAAYVLASWLDPLALPVRLLAKVIAAIALVLVTSMTVLDRNQTAALIQGARRALSGAPSPPATDPALPAEK